MGSTGGEGFVPSCSGADPQDGKDDVNVGDEDDENGAYRFYGCKGEMH